MTTRARGNLKLDQWHVALAIVKAKFAENPPAPTGYNEFQRPQGGPTLNHGAFVWTGHSGDQQMMWAVAQEFRNAQSELCCEHGRPWRNADGYSTTLEYVSFYRSCACCSATLKRHDPEGGSPVCDVCEHDELCLVSRSETALVDMLYGHGFELIERIDALAAMNAGRFVSDDCDDAIGGARRAGETLWSNDSLAKKHALDLEHDDDTQRYIDKYQRPDGSLPPKVQKVLDRRKAVMEAPVYVTSFSGALDEVASARLTALVLSS